MALVWHTKRRPKRRRRSSSASVVYLPRSTLEMEAVIAIEELADREGVSFGLALEMMLMESKTFKEFLESVKNQ